MNKYVYKKVIQQNFGLGWEDVSEYVSNSLGVVSEMSGVFVAMRSGRKRELTLLKHDLLEYIKTGYPTRVIFRRTKIK